MVDYPVVEERTEEERKLLMDESKLVLCPVCENQTYVGVEFAAYECREPACIWFDPGHEEVVRAEE